MRFNKNENLVMAADNGSNIEVENSEAKRSRILEFLGSTEKLRDWVADKVAIINPKLAWKIMTSTVKEHPLETVGGVVAGVGTVFGTAHFLEKPQQNIEVVHELTEDEKGYMKTIDDARKVIDDSHKENLDHSKK